MGFQLGGLEIVFKGRCCHSWHSMVCLLCFISKDCRRLEKEIIKPFYIMAKGYENSDIMLENRKIPMLWNDSLYTVRAMFLRTASMQPPSSESLCPRLQSRTNLSLTTFHPFILWLAPLVVGNLPYSGVLFLRQHLNFYTKHILQIISHT